VSVESGRPAPQAGGVALVAAVLAVAVVVVLDAVSGRRGVRVAVHVLLGLFGPALALLLTALEFAARFMTAPEYVLLAGLWAVGVASVLAGVLAYRDATRQVRRVATVGPGASLVWGLVATGYAVAVVESGAGRGATARGVHPTLEYR